MGFVTSLLIFSSVVHAVILAPFTRNVTSEYSQKYLVKFGYMEEPEDTKSGQQSDPQVFNEAVRQFQEMAGINQTGFVDEDTERFMRLPRCGNRDIMSKKDTSQRRKKRWAVRGGKWNHHNLTYNITTYPTSMTERDTDVQIAKAFQVWEKEANLTFRKTNTDSMQKPDIEIKFVAGEHGDGRPFDGKGVVIAHAFFPNYGGDAHFDDAETFTSESNSGINLFYAAAHEIGHAIGLDHTKISEALMAPFYKGYVPDLKLHPDDIIGVHYLYGRKRRVSPTPTTPRTTTPETTTPRPTPSPRPRPTPSTTPRPTERKHVCDIQKLDAVINYAREYKTYIFSGEYYWRLDRFRAEDGYPKKITEHWNLPANLDAALDLADKSGVVYFFKGDQYWKYSKSDEKMVGYPKTIGLDGFHGVPTDMDSSFMWSGNSRIYFTKGSHYYRFEKPYNGDPHSIEQYRASPNYPKPLSRWRGLPRDKVDAAVQLPNRVTYFFRDGHYYRFNDRTFEVRDGYPKSTLLYWVGCNEFGQLQVRPKDGSSK